MSLTGVLGAIAIAVLLAISYADRYLPALSDWYFNLAAPAAVRSTNQLAADEVDHARKVRESGESGGSGDAYLACARRAAKRDQSIGFGAVVTFAPERESRTTWIGRDRVVIRSTFDEAFENGAMAVNAFCCTARREKEAWVVESMKVRRVASYGDPPTGPGLPD